MSEIEKSNPGLKGVLPKDYNRLALDKVMLGELIDPVSGIGMGEPSDKAKDILGRVYEYFLGGFAGSERKRGGEFYTPRSVVRVLVEMLEPYKGRVYDPCCGSGGMFVQSEKFVESHGGRIGDIAIYGQESNYTTWRLGHWRGRWSTASEVDHRVPLFRMSHRDWDDYGVWRPLRGPRRASAPAVANSKIRLARSRNR
jgi:type I restriction-modification system DNA methylase subunit